MNAEACTFCNAFTHNHKATEEKGGAMENTTAFKRGVFLVLFTVLTLLCWCPFGYGVYGPPALILAMPSWAVIALTIGVIMFLLELIFLFGTNLTLHDDQLPDILESLKKDVQ
ncbi:MAG: DUF997 domain-containing protein [Desulfobacteraceae bacterium]